VTGAVRQEGRRLAAKRAMDVVLGAVAAIALAPLVVASATLVRCTMGSPVLFRQRRAGRHGRPFEVLKIRTMTDRRGPDGQLLDDAARLTPVGRFLRSTSLDETPQLWNVLCGEMSLVGPRPLLVGYLNLYSAEQARRHDVLPGITGWAQIHVRNSLDWDEKLALDLRYVDTWSLGLDLKILLLTPPRVLLRRGISRPGHATMPVFTGPAGRREG
jgi:lipopolysaccharide/colanic/teichoic acid biosynthesis glycosyltransferase